MEVFWAWTELRHVLGAVPRYQGQEDVVGDYCHGGAAAYCGDDAGERADAVCFVALFVGGCWVWRCCAEGGEVACCCHGEGEGCGGSIGHID